jgi:hypothetical protein
MMTAEKMSEAARGITLMRDAEGQVSPAARVGRILFRETQLLAHSVS